MGWEKKGFADKENINPEIESIICRILSQENPKKGEKKNINSNASWNYINNNGG